jgi:hypothetical protein
MYGFIPGSSHSAKPNLPQWPMKKARNPICHSGPLCGGTFKPEYLGKFHFKIYTALDHDSDDQLGTFGGTTLDI